MVADTAPGISSARVKHREIPWFIDDWWDIRYGHDLVRFCECSGYGYIARECRYGVNCHITGDGVDEGRCGWHVGSGRAVSRCEGSGYAIAGCAHYRGTCTNGLRGRMNGLRVRNGVVRQAWCEVGTH